MSQPSSLPWGTNPFDLEVRLQKLPRRRGTSGSIGFIVFGLVPSLQREALPTGSRVFGEFGYRPGGREKGLI
jgi:hypothetical protein